MSMDVTATLFNMSVPCKILNSTVRLLQLRGLSLAPRPSQGERFYERRGEEEKKNI